MLVFKVEHVLFLVVLGEAYERGCGKTEYKKASFHVERTMS